MMVRAALQEQWLLGEEEEVFEQEKILRAVSFLRAACFGHYPHEHSETAIAEHHRGFANQQMSNLLGDFSNQRADVACLVMTLPRAAYGCAKEHAASTMNSLE